MRRLGTIECRERITKRERGIGGGLIGKRETEERPANEWTKLRRYMPYKLCAAKLGSKSVLCP